MAIKKGAFDLYAQERRLPHRSDEVPIRESHFFDDIDRVKVPSTKTVHKRFTNEAADSTSPTTDAASILFESHERNGSQTVHKRFTNETDGGASPIADAASFVVESQESNGSQTVHKRFTSEAEDNTSSVANAALLAVEPHENNGSQMVHKRFTSEAEDNTSSVANAALLAVEPHENNGLQTVHKRFTNDSSVNGKLDFSSLIGNQRKLVLSLYRCIQLNDGLITRTLTLDEISIMASVNKKSLKNTLFRLTNAGFILRTEQKVGRGGWVKYRLHSDLMNELSGLMI